MEADEVIVDGGGNDVQTTLAFASRVSQIIGASIISNPVQA